MINLPDSERIRFESLLAGHARRYELSPEDYLRKVWFHEQAASLGEYVALTFLGEILPLAPQIDPQYEVIEAETSP